MIARLLSKLVYFRLFVCLFFVRLSVRQYFLCNPPFGASVTLLLFGHIIKNNWYFLLFTEL